MEHHLYISLKKDPHSFHPLVPFNASEDKLLAMDFTAANTDLTDEILADTNAFSDYVSQKLRGAKATYGIGGYNEHRTIYSRSTRFDGAEEPRRLHLGIDIWGKAGTPIYAPLDAVVHSFNFNNYYGDYGATIILEHQLENYPFHTLYGHLSLRDIADLQEGSTIKKGTEFAHFGIAEENGHWPPHLHFQVIDVLHQKGDYHGVCRFSEREKYLKNCPDPDIILNMMQYVNR